MSEWQPARINPYHQKEDIAAFPDIAAKYRSLTAMVRRGARPANAYPDCDSDMWFEVSEDSQELINKITNSHRGTFPGFMMCHHEILTD